VKWRRGYGTQVVEAATRYIVDKGVDIDLTTSHLGSFYMGVGWIPGNDQNLVWRSGKPTVVDERVLMLVLSEKGKQDRSTFEDRPIYVGANSW
jgi:hypothetical protein